MPRPPDISSRAAALRELAKAERFELPDDVARFIAEEVEGGALVQAHAVLRIGMWSKHGGSLSIEHVREVLGRQWFRLPPQT